MMKWEKDLEKLPSFGALARAACSFLRRLPIAITLGRILKAEKIRGWNILGVISHEASPNM